MDPTPLKQALQVAPERTVVSNARPEQEFFCFKLGDLRIGVPSESVREVTKAVPLTPLPRSAPFVLGVMGHRGEVLTVIDLLRFLGKGEARITPRTRFFVGVNGALTAAILADQVIGLKAIAVADILPPPMGGDVSAEHLIGVVSPGKPAEVLTLVNLAKLFQTARAKAVGR